MTSASRITFVVLLVVVAVGAYYGLVRTKERVTPVAPIDMSTTTGDALTSRDVSSSAAPTSKPASSASATLPVPSLARPVKAYIALDPKVSADAIQASNRLIAVLRDNPDDYSSYLFLGVYRKTLGDYIGAEELWRYVTVRWPTDYVAYNNLGNLYHENLPDFPKAEQYFLKTAALKPDFTQTYLNLYDLYRYSYKGKEAEAPHILLVGLSKNPTDVNLMITLARYYVDIGNTELAAKYYKMAIQEDEKALKTAAAASLRREAAESHLSL